MAISPTVQQYQQQSDDLENSNTTDAESLFKQKFGEAAYKVVQSKFASLLPYVITFKTIEVDVDNGQGVGAFVVQRGQDVVYIPVVLSEGSIESCEMFYDKVTDTFTPASKKEVDKLISTNRLGKFTLSKKVPRDTTPQMFRNMFRPPVSSRPITMASGADLSSLPNKAKEALSTYIMENTQLLGKIAEFYPVEVLATKLAKSEEKLASEEIKDIVEVISIDELTKEAARALTSEDKDDLLGEGYVIKSPSAKTAPIVMPRKNLPVEVVTSLNLSEVDLRESYSKSSPGINISPKNNGILGKGTIYCTGGTYIKNETGLISRCMFFNFNKSTLPLCVDKIVVANYDTDVTISDLTKIGATNIDSLSIPEGDRGSIYVFYKTKSGNYQLLNSNQIGVDSSGHQGTPMIQHLEESTIVTGTCGTTYEFSEAISFGYINATDNITILPKHSTLVYFIPSSDAYPLIKEKPISSIYQLITLFGKLGRSLRLVGDGVDTYLRDSALNKEAHFSNKKDLISHLVVNYDFNKEAVDTLMQHKEVLAFDANYDPYINHMANLAGTGLVPSPQTEDTPLVNTNMINDAASLGDQEIMDTGLIASVANTQDIKTYLLDMLPNFIKTTTDLGKAILLYLVKSKEFKEYYGREEYSNFLGTLRRMFVGIGDITTDLRAYTNNQ